jgi:hypothetical protein
VNKTREIATFKSMDGKSSLKEINLALKIMLIYQEVGARSSEGCL